MLSRFPLKLTHLPYSFSFCSPLLGTYVRHYLHLRLNETQIIQLMCMCVCVCVLLLRIRNAEFALPGWLDDWLAGWLGDYEVLLLLCCCVAGVIHECSGYACMHAWIYYADYLPLYPTLPRGKGDKE